MTKKIDLDKVEETIESILDFAVKTLDPSRVPLESCAVTLRTFSLIVFKTFLTYFELEENDSETKELSDLIFSTTSEYLENLAKEYYSEEETTKNSSKNIEFTRLQKAETLPKEEVN